MKPQRPLLVPIIATGALLALIHLLYFFLPQGTLQVLPWFVPVISSTLALAAFCVAYLAFGRYQVLHYPAPYWVGVGFLFAGTLALVHIFTFPSLPGGRSIISTVPSVTAWLANARVLLLAACYFAAVYAKWPGTSASPRRFSLVTTALCIGGTLLITWLSIRFDHLLPVLVLRGRITSAGTAFFLLTAALLLANSILITRHYLNRGDTLFGHAAISQLAFAATLTIHVLGSAWYDFWFYLGRIIHLLGSLTMMFGLFGDYLQLFRREQEKTRELQTSEERFRTTFENAAVGMAHVGLDGRWLRVNERLVALLGYSREELSSMTFQEVTHPEDLATDLREYGRLQRGEIESLMIEKRYIRKEGRIVWARLTVSLLRRRDGVPVHAIAIIEDITDRKKAEEALQRTVEELQKARDYLEVRVKERTAELTQALQELRTETEERIRAVEELRRREQLLIQQSRMAAMGEMLRNISHQWRQPLNVVAARVQKLEVTYQYGGFSEELLKETISNVMASIKQMSRTIDEFQEFLEPTEAKSFFAVDDVIRKTISVLGEAFQSQGITIEFQSNGAAEVYGDAGEYGQVLMNLLANAKDALLQRRETERRIWIKAWTASGRSVVTVTDNAGGIEEAISEIIFDAYFTTKELGKGTGVGLFLSKMIIEKNMGGRLTFRNVEGGAEFEIRV